MKPLDIIAYVSDAWVLATYAWLARRAKPIPFHWANALGAAPLLVIEVTQKAWPVLPLTSTFCLLGWWGLWTEYVTKRAGKGGTVSPTMISGPR